MISKKTPESLITIDPNPSTGLFTVSASSENEKSIFLYNPMGKVVFEKTLTCERHVTIDIRHLCKGLYLLKVLSGEKCQIETISVRS